MSEQLSSDPGIAYEEADGKVLRIDSIEWSSVEFYVSGHDGELNIEITDAEQTWLTVAEARRLRDWLIEELR